MDSRGRALVNIFVEQLWRSLKHEDIYLKAMSALSVGESNLFDFPIKYSLNKTTT
jgi:hypothetical protein